MELYEKGIFLVDGKLSETADNSIAEGKKKTMAAKIIAAHDTKTDPDVMHVKFDSLTSHDITYVGIIQTARASGSEEVSRTVCIDKLPQYTVCRWRDNQ
jgi:aconitate hydratase